ncbi:hypothetical protein BH24ACT23_BH24ACT23_10170 [soil metagenome]
MCCLLGAGGYEIRKRGRCRLLDYRFACNSDSSDANSALAVRHVPALVLQAL